MNNFDDWSQIISKYLHSEADPLSSLAKHEIEDDAARTAFIHAVLDRFLPEMYGVGSGQIMDSRGRLSKKMDIIIYRRDFPRLDLPGSRDIFLYESVIAVFEVVGKLIKKTFYDALDQCASLGKLQPDIDPKVLTGLAARNQLTMNENRQYIHPDPIRTARFHLIGRPVSFIYGFSGYKTSPNQLSDTIQGWLDDRLQEQKSIEMKDLPAVIATHGCFAWRNSAPLTFNEHSLMGIGKDPAPIRLIVLQLLHVLSRRLKVTTDGYGLKPGLDAYIKRMPPPRVELFVGKAKNPQVISEGSVDKLSGQKSTVTSAVSQSALSAASSGGQSNAAKQVKSVAEVKKKQVAGSQSTPGKNAAETKMNKEEPSEKPEIEIKTRPAAQSATAVSQTENQPRKSASNPLSSLNPKPKAVNAPMPVPNADMVPDLEPDPPAGDGSKLSSAIDRSSKMVAAVDSASNKFMDTVKMSLQEQPKKTADSAEEFLETVKMNMASPEPIPHLQPESEPEPEPFTSTIPQ